MLDYALTLEGPSVIRYPRGGDFEEDLPEPAPLEYGKAQILRESPDGPVIWALGAECGTMEKAALLLRKKGIGATLINARFVSPFDAGLARRFRSRLQVTVEDHGPGGLAAALDEALAGEGAPGGVLSFCWGHEAVGYGNVAQLRRKAGLDPENIVRRIVEKLSAESQKLH
jgi:1-deoxy-D-xylulose-5-phosphate synthase